MVAITRRVYQARRSTEYVQDFLSYSQTLSERMREREKETETEIREEKTYSQFEEERSAIANCEISFILINLKFDTFNNLQIEKVFV